MAELNAWVATVLIGLELHFVKETLLVVLRNEFNWEL